MSVCFCCNCGFVLQKTLCFPDEPCSNCGCNTWGYILTGDDADGEDIPEKKEKEMIKEDVLRGQIADLEEEVDFWKKSYINVKELLTSKEVELDTNKVLYEELRERFSKALGHAHEILMLME